MPSRGLRARPRSPGPTRDLAQRLHSAAIRLLRRLRSQDVATGLTGPQASALSVIVFRGPLALGELAAAEQVRPPSITRLVRELETAGLVKRDADQKDARVRRVRATARGRQVLEAGRARRVATLAAALRGLSGRDRSAVRRAVGALERLLK
jgi:DNA-binding MarR family transcriptional regulator